MAGLRVVFLGNDRWSVPTLDALADADDIEVVRVITNPARPAGRGSRLRSTAVADAAERRSLPLLEVAGVRSGPGADAIEEIAPQVLVVVAYGELLPRAILAVPELGSLNLHFSLLPRWRGAAPVQRAILEGDRVTGVSVMMVDEGLDTGPVVLQAEEAIREDDDAGSLGSRLAEIGAPLVVEALRSIRDGTAEIVPQAPAAAITAAKVLPAEREIAWNVDADAVVRRIRALAPAPGAVTTFRGSSMKIVRAEVGAPHGPTVTAVRRPGLLHLDEDGTPTVAATGGSIVRLLEVVPAGKPRMTGAGWARGARFEPGEYLG